MKPNKDWILWSLVSAFILIAIGGMWAIDYVYAPEMINSTVLPEAAGK
jgi:hypothetical protein